MAEKRTIDINIKNNADEATKDFNTFNDALDETAKSAKNVNSTFEEVYGDLQPLTTRLGEAEDRLYELALAGDTTSKEYQELLTKVGEYRKVQIQTDLAVDGAATTMTQKLGSALNATTSGFAATQGAMALFGSENEALEKSLLKVQAALAIQQGVQGLTEAYKELSIGTKLAGAAQAIFSTVVGTTSGALKVFRLALISTGIGAIVVAVGLLIANFDKVTKVIKNAINFALKPIKVAIDAVVDAYYAVTDALGITSKAERQREKQAKINAANAKKRAAERKQQFKDLQQEVKRTIGAYQRLDETRQKSLDKEIALLKASGKETRALERQKLVSVINTEAKILQERIKTLKESEKAGSEWVKMQQKLILAQQVQNAKDAEFQLRLFDAETNKIKSDNYKKYVDERKALDKQIQDAELALREDGLEKDLEANRIKFERQREQIKGNGEKQVELRRLYTDLELKAEQEIRQKYYDEEKAQAQELIDFNEELRLKEIEDNKTKNLAILQANKEAYEKQKALDEKAAKEKAERQQAQIDLAVQGLQLVAGFAELFAGDDEKRQKKAFQIKKAADIAAATVDGYRAVLSTYAQTPGGPVLKGIAAGIAGGFASLQIANIAKQQFQGGSGDVSVDTGGAGGGEVQAPQFNVVGDSGINQLAQLQQPTQAFVVSGEVTSAQALDRNRVTNATL